MSITKPTLTVYFFATAVSFIYFVTPYRSSLGIVFFTLLQFAFLCVLLPKKRPLWLFVPIMILSLNYFISANPMWRVSNFYVIWALYASMGLMAYKNFSIQKALVNMLKPLKVIRFARKSEDNRRINIGRIALALLITLPAVIFLLIMLSSADLIFAKYLESLLSFDMLWSGLLKTIYGIAVGLYLLGLLTAAAVGEKEEAKADKENAKSYDLLTLNILLPSALFIYTIFIVMQFQYLFCQGRLPFGLSFAEYARKGFFELLFLSGVNILLILVSIALTKNNDTKLAKPIKPYLHYLCLITIILLVSSFYRMLLYSDEYGLTRLRLLVLIFLVFEAIALFITFWHIHSQKLKIISIYIVTCLAFYLCVNIVPIDYLIAKSQIEMQRVKSTEDVLYLSELSADAAPYMLKIKNDPATDEHLRNLLQVYYIDYYGYDSFSEGQSWQAFNLSLYKMKKAYHNAYRVHN